MNLGNVASMIRCSSCGFDIWIYPNQATTICEHCKTVINLNTINFNLEGDNDMMNKENKSTIDMEGINEIWLPVVGYEELYEVSSLGKVKSLGRVVYCSDGRVRHCKGKIMKQCESGKRENDKQGYLQVRLTNENGESEAKCVHVLVAEAFISNYENKPTVNHKDGNKHNNNVDNLEWATYSENNQHAYDTNLKTDNRKIVMLDNNNTLIRVFNSIHEGARETNLDHRRIQLVCKGKRKSTGGYKWKYIEDFEITNEDLYFSKVEPNAVIPSKRDEDCAYDIYTCETDTIVINPCSTRMIDTGIAIACSSNYFPKFFDKGGMGSKGIIVGAGVGDSGYRDKYFIPLINTHDDKWLVITNQSQEEIDKADYFDLDDKLFKKYKEKEEFKYDTVNKKDCIIKPLNKAITQFVMLPVPKMNVKEITYEELKNIKSERGLGKLGSSGK